MTLPRFIVENIDRILSEWVEFAQTLVSGRELDLEALRDHARLMLLAVAKEMETDQSAVQQEAKSRGEAPVDLSAEETAAESHGDQRYGVGFTLEELVSEYRALRATVIRLWASQAPLDERTLCELTRFNEGIDQLLAESVVHFSRQLDRARELFMGVLGHDLRTDLHVIIASSERLGRIPSIEHVEKYVPHIQKSANNILGMVEDLLDVTRTRLGGQLPIETQRMDAAGACEEVLRPFRELHPTCDLRLHVQGDVVGEWDRKRIHQLLANLVRNAIQHGDAGREITVSAHGSDETVVFRVHNYGRQIPRSSMVRIFDPMQQGEDRTDASSLGLGLYIASTIAQGHRGTISVSSSEGHGTTFTVTLPRRVETRLGPW
ncbi:HAMP domain-containing sensor histidine kinase [Povalibacter sp.]|uniref:sensor histidine kinase n=1 Tax=Povalibacter sp. TaxID=1962978 RepID=UPI002F425FAE